MRTFTVSFIVALLAISAPSFATRQVRVYEANVSSQTDPAVQAQSAMRMVLVRATGARDAANDPALAQVLAQASNYVLGTRPAGAGGASAGTTIMFDGSALERDITAAGRTIWSSERPLLLIVLTGGPAAGAFESRRQIEGALDSAGNRRGQPIRIARPEAIGLPAVGDIAPDAALQVAQRQGADAVMIGYGDAVTDGGAWRWSLSAPGISETWNGSLEEGLHGAADLFVRHAQTYAVLPEVSVLVEVDGVPTLKEYARASAMLADAAGVRSVQLADAAGTRAIFAVLARGGSDALLGSLANNPRFERIDPKAGGALAFRLRP